MTGLVAYANDAMEGLDLAHQLMDEERRAALRRTLDAETQRLLASAAKPAAPAPRAGRRTSSVRQDVEIPLPPDLKPHVVRAYDLAEVFRYINPVMLYTRHLGLRNYETALAGGDPRAKELAAAVAAVEEVMLGRADIAANAVYRFFPARSDGDRTVMIYSSDGKTVLESLTFGRQSDEPGLCLADYVAPALIGQNRLPVHVCDHDWRGRARAGRRVERAWRVLALAHSANPRA